MHLILARVEGKLMTQSNESRNHGVVVTGGTLSANNLAVGNKASIIEGGQNNEPTKSLHKELLTELSLLIELMEKEQLDRDQISAVNLAKSELENTTPNIFLAKSIMTSVINTVKTIDSFTGNVMNITKILGVLLP